MSGTFINVLA